MRRLKSILKSWDFGIAVLLTVATCLVLPLNINMKFALTFYSVAMTVLSIIFSLFFTAMAIIMSSSDNDFIEFLEERGTFTELLWSFKITLLVLFVSLLLSIFLYVGTSYWLEVFSDKNWVQNKFLFLLLEFPFLYGMLATWFCILDTVQFSKFRSKFLSIKKQDEEQEQ